MARNGAPRQSRGRAAAEPRQSRARPGKATPQYRGISFGPNQGGVSRWLARAFMTRCRAFQTHGSCPCFIPPFHATASYPVAYLFHRMGRAPRCFEPPPYYPGTNQDAFFTARRASIFEDAGGCFLRFRGFSATTPPRRSTPPPQLTSVYVGIASSSLPCQRVAFLGLATSESTLQRTSRMVLHRRGRFHGDALANSQTHKGFVRMPQEFGRLPEPRAFLIFNNGHRGGVS